jgi:hypothetical protein
MAIGSKAIIGGLFVLAASSMTAPVGFGAVPPLAAVDRTAARKPVVGWESALAVLCQAAKETTIKEIDNEWSRNVLASLFPNCETRIYRVGIKGYQHYVLRKGDERIYLFGNVDDVLALAKAENVVLPDEQKVQLFAVLLKHGDRVSKRSQAEWELYRQLSGVWDSCFRVLELDEKSRPVAVGPVRIWQSVRRNGQLVKVETAPFWIKAAKDRPPAAPDAGENIAWGKAKDDVRVGLSPKTVKLKPDEKTFTVRVWYENVGRQLQRVPVHKNANMYTLMFSGNTDGKPFYAGCIMARAETLPPRPHSLKPGERFSETFGLGLAVGDDDTRFYLPELKAGESLTLQAGWTPFGDAATAEHFNDPRTRTSGAITIRREGKKPKPNGAAARASADVFEVIKAPVTLSKSRLLGLTEAEVLKAQGRDKLKPEPGAANKKSFSGGVVKWPISAYDDGYEWSRIHILTFENGRVVKHEMVDRRTAHVSIRPHAPDPSIRPRDP